MPKFIGQTAPAGSLRNDNAASCGLVQLTYSQMRLLEPCEVFYALDTTDRGGPGRMAKRWYKWYATTDAILACPRCTPAMCRRVV